MKDEDDILCSNHVHPLLQAVGGKNQTVNFAQIALDGTESEIAFHSGLV